MIDLRTRTLWVPPDTLQAKQAALDAASNPVRSRMMGELAKLPTAVWLTGSSTGSYVDSLLDKAGDAFVVFVVYFAPMRDLGSYSGGGATSAPAYRGWIDGIASGLHGRLCGFVIEPDGTSMAPRMTEAARAERYDCIGYAVDALTAAGGLAWIDAGDNGWISDRPAMAEALIRCGVRRGRGFATNVAHFRRAADEHAYARELRALIGGDPRYVVDTSRCGRGPYSPLPGESSQTGWCNPPGAGYGPRPSLKLSTTSYPGCDGHLWIKGLIASDGSREGAPDAGKPYPENAVRMYHRAVPKLPVVW